MPPASPRALAVLVVGLLAASTALPLAAAGHGFTAPSGHQDLPDVLRPVVDDLLRLYEHVHELVRLVYEDTVGCLRDVTYCLVGDA